jgi:hypothetical protein
MTFKRINNLAGWLVCFIACFVYIKTMEASGSLWDCGEFASGANKLQTPHSPGAPFFVLVGRLFMIPFGGQNAAIGVNLLSALSSGFTILFLFWSITHFAKKLLVGSLLAEPTKNQTFTIIAAGAIGGLAFTFSDTFWYSAVESEVYAFASFFTALLFWCALKWEQAVCKEEAAGTTGHFTTADRWLVLAFFLMGLSIGVHLLNLLVLPAIMLVYFFKKYKYTNKSLIIAIIIACITTGFLQKAMIQWTIKLAGSFDVLFVNTFGTPFFFGFGFFFVALFVLLAIAVKISGGLLKLSTLCFIFILYGTFVPYFMILARSNANPSMDMSNVDNPISLMSYLAREQYGDWPILYGQDFTDEPSDNIVENTYVKAGDKYEEWGRKVSYVYSNKHLFPRMWDSSNDVGRADYYAAFAGIGKNQDGTYERAPTMFENISFAIQYQMNWMYWRYFFWNFVGKQNDNQGFHLGNVRDGNWKSGIGIVDNLRLGSQDNMPESLKNNKANNRLFALPLVLGILGFIFHFKRKKEDAIPTFALFLLTGLGIIFYLNPAGFQPRERDYAFVSSFYVFGIWIGLGVVALKVALEKYIKNHNTNNYVTAAVCALAVPVLMASQEWDDHDRSKKTIARDLAISYLESCDKDAILITFGDNDTYPLWYAQEVEGIRKDVRVINYSLLGTDWYINQMRYKINNSDPIDVIFTEEQIVGANRDVIYKQETSGVSGMELYDMLKNYAANDAKAQQRDGQILAGYPTNNVYLEVDENLVRANKTVTPTDVVEPVAFQIKKNYLFKNETAVLAIIAANKWKRPIYFTTPNEAGIGFKDYLRQEGMCYRLVPVKGDDMNAEKSYKIIMDHFKFGGAEKPGVYFDEENRRHLVIMRLVVAQVAERLALEGQPEKARQILDKIDKGILAENAPYGIASRDEFNNGYCLQLVQAAYMANYPQLAEKIGNAIEKDAKEQIEHINSLSDSKQERMDQERQRAQRVLAGLQDFKEKNKTGYYQKAVEQTKAYLAQKNQPGNNTKVPAKILADSPKAPKQKTDTAKP